MISVSGDVSVCEGEGKHEGEGESDGGGWRRVSIWILCRTLEGARVGVGVRIRVETHPRKIIL